jgi:hypothetical protein
MLHTCMDNIATKRNDTLGLANWEETALFLPLWQAPQAHSGFFQKHLATAHTYASIPVHNIDKVYTASLKHQNIQDDCKGMYG